MAETLCFKIDGEWITNTARSWFWDEDKDYEVVEELLLNCLVTDLISLEERKDIVREIIEGRKKLIGINTFSLEDDGLNIRPIYKKIQELKRKEEINKIKNDMEIHPSNYIDVFSIKENFKNYLEKCEENPHYNSFEGVFDFFYDEENASETNCGLWILDKPSLVYELVGGVVTDSNKDEFFEKLYEYLKKKINLSDSMKNRQSRYEQFKRIGEVKEVDYSYKGDLPKYVESDYLFGEPKLNYYGRPDEQLSQYGWINRLGEWFSCEFGGHQLKAEVIVRMNEKIEKDFNLWIKEVGEDVEENLTLSDSSKVKFRKIRVKSLNNSWYIEGDELYSEYLFRKGWIKFHNPYLGECFPQFYLKPTREQNDAMFKASLKFGYKKLQGLDTN